VPCNTLQHPTRAPQHRLGTLKLVPSLCCGARVGCCKVLHGTCVLMPLCDILCCRETLRRDPVVSGLMRVAARDFEVSGYMVPAGKMLILPLKYLSANDARWVNEAGELSPEAFVPERMMTADAQKAGDLLPFGYGPRCAL